MIAPATRHTTVHARWGADLHPSSSRMPTYAIGIAVRRMGDPHRQRVPPAWLGCRGRHGGHGIHSHERGAVTMRCRKGDYLLHACRRNCAIRDRHKTRAHRRSRKATRTRNRANCLQRKPSRQPCGIVRLAPEAADFAATVTYGMQ